MTTHECTERCTGRVTDELLGELGFPVQRTETIMGTRVVTREGKRRDQAVHAAWQAGELRLCSRLVPR